MTDTAPPPNPNCVRRMAMYDSLPREVRLAYGQVSHTGGVRTLQHLAEMAAARKLVKAMLKFLHQQAERTSNALIARGVYMAKGGLNLEDLGL